MKKGSIFIGCGHLIRNIEDFRGLFAKSGATITVPSLDSHQFNESEMIKYLPGHVTAILGDDGNSKSARCVFPNFTSNNQMGNWY